MVFGGRVEEMKERGNVSAFPKDFSPRSVCA